MTRAEAIAHLQTQLAAAASPERREWWARYMKGTASFRGVTMEETRDAVRQLWQGELHSWPAGRARGLAVALLAEPLTEDKLAGILLLSEHLHARLSAAHLPELAQPFERGRVADWGATDWFGVKVLAPLLRRDGDAFATPLLEWLDAESLWQRRAPAVAFAWLAAKPEPYSGFTAQALRICRALARDEQRFSQTAVGWLARELSHQHPQLVQELVDELGERLSKEARRMARAKIEGRGRR